MQSKLLDSQQEQTFALIFEAGDEVIGGLTEFAREHRIVAAHFSAIGALQSVTLGYFDRERKEYLKIPLEEQVEVLSLLGDVALKGEEPKIHAHVVVGKRDGSAHGGHVIEAKVWPTLEVILTDSPRYLRRKYDEESGLALIDLDAMQP
jgi:predicted DNA-binding protein with PD1-like motif